MCFVVLAFEVPLTSNNGGSGGIIGPDCPREVYNRLGWREWSAGIPGEWTLFLPLNSRYAPLHDRGAMMEESIKVDREWLNQDFCEELF